ncbi:3-phosphoshikimate 1-carboxyvinyltransferase, partial [Catellatospora methionotrophica]
MSEISLPSVIALSPVEQPPDTTVRLPGSKSITNRALLCAALAEGESTLSGVLFADDTRAMLGAAAALGAQVTADEAAATVTVRGTDPREAGRPVSVYANQSGTTARFVLPALALRTARGVLDGDAQLR